MNNKIKSAQVSVSIFEVSKRLRQFLLPSLAYLLIAYAMVSCKSNNGNLTTGQAGTNNDSQAIAVDSLQSRNTANRSQIDRLATQKSLLDSQINRKDAEIAKLKNRISHLEKHNKSLAGVVKKDKKLITSLKDEVADKAREFAERIGLLEADKSNLMHQRDSLYTQYATIKALGSVLHASDIRMIALHLKHHGKTEKNTKRARRADVLRVYFDIDENRIAEDGTKQLYLVIKDPDGKLLNNPKDGSCTTTTTKGDQLNYSLLKSIPLKQDEPVYDVTCDWKQDTDYKKGAYTVAIYNGGYKIGGGKVSLN